jgi:hypothetical protein
MDETAEKLLQELGGSRSQKIEKSSTSPAGQHQPGVHLHEGEYDRWRILLVELVYLLNTSFQDVYYWEGIKAEKDTFRQLVRILEELNQMPVHDGTVCITLRGARIPKISEKADYMIQYGEIEVDVVAISALINRMGIRLKHLEGRLIKSFEAFADQGISSLRLTLPGESIEGLENLKVSLRVISCFKQAVEKNSPISYQKDGNPYSLYPILNERNQPDSNLTCLAAINDLSQGSMMELVQKVSAKMGNKKGNINVYQALFKIKSLRQRLIKPPLEIHSDTLTVTERGQKTSPDGALYGKTADEILNEIAHLKMNQTALKEGVARFVKGAFRKSPDTAKQVMKSIYGTDYKLLDTQELSGRLKLITNLLAMLQKNPQGENIEGGVLRRIQEVMDQVPGEVLDDFVVQDEELNFWSEGEVISIGEIDINLLKILDDSKARSGARRKKKISLNPEKQFGSRDFEAISHDFGVPIHEAKDIIDLFKSCFDNQGNFLRATFEKNVPVFARHEKKVFEILWEFLKETSRRSDRMPFLNSLQLLIREIGKPIQAIKVLLADFLLDPGTVTFPDRNAMMLAIQFLRKYNKEVNVDIEITPEEVLLVQEGLDKSVVNYVVWKVDGEQKKFLEKAVFIRKRLLESLDPDISGGQILPLRFLLGLEREVHIFLSLVGGKTAYELMRSALGVYGNPDSQVYCLQESPQHMETLLLHLSVVIRGFGRLGLKEDLVLLDAVEERKDRFMELGEDGRHHALVNRIQGVIDASKNLIGSRS